MNENNRQKKVKKQVEIIEKKLPKEDLVLEYGVDLDEESGYNDEEILTSPNESLLDSGKNDYDWSDSNSCKKDKKKKLEKTQISKKLEKKFQKTSISIWQPHHENFQQISTNLIKKKDKAPAGNVFTVVNQTKPSKNSKRKGCTCKRSQCTKNYCECYQSGLGCIPSCRCFECKNLYDKVVEEDVIYQENVDKSWLGLKKKLKFDNEPPTESKKIEQESFCVTNRHTLKIEMSVIKKTNYKIKKNQLYSFEQQNKYYPSNDNHEDSGNEEIYYRDQDFINNNNQWDQNNEDSHFIMESFVNYPRAVQRNI